MDIIMEGNLRHCHETESISFWVPGKGSSLVREGKEAAFNFIPPLFLIKKIMCSY